MRSKIAANQFICVVRRNPISKTIHCDKCNTYSEPNNSVTPTQTLLNICSGIL
ncbi:hypothetical protein PROFUN_03890 [Planoprotostelium fungivorum]|uniref:Uncharacterized protein n=1 Tax=Planoprotostelium fungivorum TaxID=1890364 RepID=A0A2P6MTP9_9EUKA|nr:hypothetical protein PROFUN_03890 [Planoprotostelium fungivorum]